MTTDPLKTIKDALQQAIEHEEAMRISYLLAKAQTQCLRDEVARLEQSN